MTVQQWPCIDCRFYHDGTTVVETAVRTVKGGPILWTDAPMWREGTQWKLAGCEHGHYAACKGTSAPRARGEPTPGCDGVQPGEWEGSNDRLHSR